MHKFSAEDIANQDFETRFRGYDCGQVHEFLNVLSREWGHLVEELRRTRELLEEQSRELKDFRQREKSLHDALHMAREMADEIRHQAEREAELLLADAEVKAEKMLVGAEGRVAALREDLLDLQQQEVRYRSQMRSVVESHLRLLDFDEAGPQVGQSSIPRAPQSSASDAAVTARHETIEVRDEDITEARHASQIEEASATSPGI